MISSVDTETEKNSMILEDEREQIYRALEKYDSHSQYFLPEEDLNTVNYLMTCLCDFLKADAEPVRHGHWEKLYDRNYKCSVCGAWYRTDEEEEILDFDYCPHCGAKMDEVTE